MSYQTVSGKYRNPGLLPNHLCQSLPMLIRHITPAILPGIQRTDTSACPIHIEDSVHLSGQTDGRHLRISMQQSFQNFPCFLNDFIYILYPFPFPRSLHKCSIGNGSGFPYFLLLRIQHYQTDGSGPDINAQYLHLHTPIKIHYPNYNTHQKFLQLDILPFLLYDVN